jgi:hypothetical protein
VQRRGGRGDAAQPHAGSHLWIVCRAQPGTTHCWECCHRRPDDTRVDRQLASLDRLDERSDLGLAIPTDHTEQRAKKAGAVADTDHPAHRVGRGGKRGGHGADWRTHRGGAIQPGSCGARKLPCVRRYDLAATGLPIDGCGATTLARRRCGGGLHLDHQRLVHEGRHLGGGGREHPRDEPLPDCGGADPLEALAGAVRRPVDSETLHQPVARVAHVLLVAGTRQVSERARIVRVDAVEPTDTTAANCERILHSEPVKEPTAGTEAPRLTTASNAPGD